MHAGRQRSRGGMVRELAKTGGHGACGTGRRASLPPVLPRIRPPSRRRNRSARPQAIAPERGDPFRQDIEIKVSSWVDSNGSNDRSGAPLAATPDQRGGPSSARTG
jgi:hypothetical protein